MKDSQTQPLFSSKANTLNYLQNKLKKSLIQPLFVFSIFDWKTKKNEILHSINESFDSKFIIVRSSAKGEDSFERSEAGRYESILNIKPNNKKDVSNAINSVIHSYQKNGNIDSTNQILIQEQAQDIMSSGVIFTKTPDKSSPYYVINYEKGSSTFGVTQGMVSNTIKIFRGVKTNSIPKPWNTLINSINEIESLLKTTFLDIEFGMTKSKKVIIFQVRPLTSIQDSNKTNLEQRLKTLISKNKRLFSSLNARKHVPGQKTFFSDMTDWNPSEIIGSNPNQLDYSLYNFLIMQKSWHIGRTKIGYQDVNPHKLMVKFGNKPYTDIRASFNSLIPNNINKNLKKKLMNYYLKKLKDNPNLYDKVEFEILLTCYDFSLANRLNELIKNGFTKKETQIIKSYLLDHTNQILIKFPSIYHDSIISIKKLNKSREKIISKINQKNYHELLHSAEILLDECKKFGTIPFSTMARIAFIANAMLKSCVKQKIVNDVFYDSLMNSIETPVSELQKDFENFSLKKITKSQFLSKYGHLRPGTYDITQLRYDSDNPFFENIQYLKKKSSKNMVKENKQISLNIKKHGLSFSNIDFNSFIIDSISQREKLKFHFTKNLSDALELIAKAGENLGFSRTELSKLDIKFIFDSYKKYNKNQIQSKWREKIRTKEKLEIVSNHLVLPPLITSKEDFDYTIYHISKPNFITKKVIKSGILYLDDIHNKIPDLKNKIILIEHADPGYDWIFTKNLLGLITKYGGAASHMAIRCAELGLSAAIGCGELLFDHLKLSSRVLLDCQNEQIIILETKKDLEEFEVKKTLKSLGYIK